MINHKLPEDITTNNKIKEGLYEYLGGSSKVMQMFLNTFLEHYRSNSTMSEYLKYKKIVDELKLLSEKLWFIDDEPTQFDKDAIVHIQQSLSRAVPNGLVYYRNPLARLQNLC